LQSAILRGRNQFRQAGATASGVRRQGGFAATREKPAAQTACQQTLPLSQQGPEPRFPQKWLNELAGTTGYLNVNPETKKIFAAGCRFRKV